MSYQNKEKLRELYTKLGDDINYYLQETPYKIINENNQQDLGAWKKENHRAYKRGGVYHVEGSNKIICVENDYFRNLPLLSRRIANMVNLKDQIVASLVRLNSEPEEEVNLTEAIEGMREKINRAMNNNNTLDVEYCKHHQTSKQLTLSGEGFFGRLFHKSATYSRARVALETAYEHLEEFAKRFTPNRSTI